MGLIFFGLGQANDFMLIYGDTKTLHSMTKDTIIYLREMKLSGPEQEHSQQ